MFSLSRMQGASLGAALGLGLNSSSSSSSAMSVVVPKRRGGALVVSAAMSGDLALTGVVFQPFEEVKKEDLMVPIAPQISLARQRFAEDCEAAINEQINVEYNVSYVYHAMFAYFDRDNVALKGLAKFFKESSEEEREHAEKFMKYQNKRGGRVKLHSILLPLSEFDHVEKGDALFAMELALSLEKLTNEKLLSLHAVADRNNDPQMCEFIESEFLTEQVGKGLSKDAKAQKLAFQHRIEAIDPRHRYGHCLHMYYEEWCKTDAGQPLFYWLDIGDGKEVELKDCPRSMLRQLCIKYLGPLEREQYEYIVVEGKIVHKQSGNFLDTIKGMPRAKWIFVVSTSKRLYAGQKNIALFHHSSFLSGGATLAAGRLEVEDGTRKSISPYSGHYRPTDDSLDYFLSFLNENGVNLDEIEIRKANEDYENFEESKFNREEIAAELSTNSESPQLHIPKEEEKDITLELTEALETETKSNYRRTLSGGLHSPRAEVPKKAILERINSKKAVSSYQLGRQLSQKWSTGAGPRIGCVADYPVELRVQALEFVNLPQRTPPPSCYRQMAGLASPAAFPAQDLYNGHSISSV